MLNVTAVSERQLALVADRCDFIKDGLKNLQKSDARARVFLGSYYETVLSKFIIPLNVRLVENNLSRADLIENQNNFATAKSTFAIDFIGYQQDLEELVLIDCRAEPEKFYQKLEIVREKRKVMAKDVIKMRELILENIKQVSALRDELK